MADIINFKTRRKRIQIKQLMFGLLKKIFSFKFKRMVAYGRRAINWADIKVIEDMDFYLFENIFGGRSYKISSYGYCKDFKTHKQYMGDVNIWLNGGPLPIWAVRTEMQQPYADKHHTQTPPKPVENNKKPDFKVYNFPKKDNDTDKN